MNLDESDRSVIHVAPPPAATSRRGLFFFAVIVIIFAILLIIIMRSRSRAQENLAIETEENSIPTVSVIHPKPSSQRIELVLPANVEAFEESPLYARAAGYVTNWSADIGARVEQGQVLAEIETPEIDQQLNQARAALGQAKANLEIARITAERWQRLRASDAVSQQDVDEKAATWHAREADVVAAEANVARFQELTRFKKVVAPFSGIITERNVDVGNLINVGSGREIFRLAKIDPLRVYISLPQAYSQVVKQGDLARLEFTEFPGQSFTGRVVRTSGAIDPISRTLLTEVQVPNHDGKLLSGAHTMAHLTVATPGIPVVVPVNTLLFRDTQGMQVGVVDTNGIVRLADVTLGRDFGTTVEIVHGISENDNVIINPSDSLEAGVPVKIAREEQSPKKR